MEGDQVYGNDGLYTDSLVALAATGEFYEVRSQGWAHPDPYTGVIHWHGKLPKYNDLVTLSQAGGLFRGRQQLQEESNDLQAEEEIDWLALLDGTEEKYEEFKDKMDNQKSIKKKI